MRVSSSVTGGASLLGFRGDTFTGTEVLRVVDIEERTGDGWDGAVLIDVRFVETVLSVKTVESVP